METILVVDDEKNYLVVLDALLAEEGYEVMTCESGLHAMRLWRNNDLDLIITDMKMPKVSGMDVLELVKKENPDFPVIMMTAFGTVEKAVEAMKKGASDYITKPFQNEELKLTVRKTLGMYRLVKQNQLLQKELSNRYQFDNMVGKSKPMLKIFELIEKVANTKATVLITGESGTGKELIARSIHFNSNRRNGPFVSVNCTALTETLLESELFGHEKGSFTGAESMRKGRFELSDKGSLFLDEVGEMSPNLQVKLLRVIQEREFERVGGTKTISVDVRIIAATNKDLRAEVQEGGFREDLFFRLNVVHIHIPPLRERFDDIAPLLSFFIDKYSREHGKKPMKLTPEAWRRVLGYRWPGNVRELENAVERAIILTGGTEITENDLPEELQGVDGVDFDIDRFVPSGVKLPEALAQVEEKMLRRALKQCHNVQTHAADLLGIEKNLLRYKLKKYNILV